MDLIIQEEAGSTFEGWRTNQDWVDWGSMEANLVDFDCWLRQLNNTSGDMTLQMTNGEIVITAFSASGAPRHRLTISYNADDYDDLIRWIHRNYLFLREVESDNVVSG